LLFFSELTSLINSELQDNIVHGERSLCSVFLN